MDSRFAGPLGLVAERALLKEHGVEKAFNFRYFQFHVWSTKMFCRAFI